MIKVEIKRRALVSWLLLGLLAVLCTALAILQYRWIGAISLAEQDRLEDNLQVALRRIANDFDRDLSAAAGSLTPDTGQVEELGVEPAYAARYNDWKASSPHPQIFRRLMLAIPGNDRLVLRKIDLDHGTFSDMEWPAEWQRLHDWMSSRLEGSPRPMQPPPSGFPGRPPGRGGGGRPPVEDTLLLDLPRFGPGTGEQNWLIAEVDSTYMARRMMPQLLDRHLGQSMMAQFHARVTYRDKPSEVVFDAGQTEGAARQADVSVTFFEARAEPMGGFRRVGPPPRPAGDSGRGRLVLSLRHNSGSLDAAVARHRRRNFAISGAIILLMGASAAILFRLSRQAQQLADLQMQFVAGVSHELRTPLTVIRTAAYNLRGKIASNPAQVERYGGLIQNESEKLSAIVEQILRFAGAKAGKVIRQREPVPVQDVVEDSILACRSLFEGSKLKLEKEVAPDLPMILADSMALQHAVQNLIQNAVKYGTEGNDWIGVSASAPDESVVEIRVADRGPGIPPEEQARVFDPFFRGKRAVQDQIHGTGLGLNLVRQIVEAHGGTIAVESEMMKGTAFVIRLPVAPAEYQDEFANSTG